MDNANKTRTAAKVELYNRFVRISPTSRKERLAGNGYYVAAYVGTQRLRTLKDFGADEAGARAYAELWNGPELDAAVNPSTAPCV
jgi:hypothetical protein